jgi:hypothetical protein
MDFIDIINSPYWSVDWAWNWSRNINRDRSRAVYRSIDNYLIDKIVIINRLKTNCKLSNYFNWSRYIDWNLNWNWNL